MRFLLTLICLLLALPVLGVLAAWLAFDADAWAVLVHQAQTVLAGYALQSLLLAFFVAIGVALLGGGAAAAVALFRFARGGMGGAWERGSKRDPRQEDHRP